MSRGKALSKLGGTVQNSGEYAVKASRQLQELKLGDREGMGSESIKRVGRKTFYLRDGIWVDSGYKKEMKAQKIEYASNAYFELIASQSELRKYLAIGKRVIVCYKEDCYEITSTTEGE